MAVPSLILAWVVNSHSPVAAQYGGALSVGVNGSHVHVQQSRFESNHAKVKCNSSSVCIVKAKCNSSSMSIVRRCFGCSVGVWRRDAALQGKLG